MEIHGSQFASLPFQFALIAGELAFGKRRLESVEGELTFRAGELTSGGCQLASLACLLNIGRLRAGLRVFQRGRDFLKWGRIFIKDEWGRG